MRVILKAISFALLIGLGGQSVAQGESADDYLFSGERAYGMLPPVVFSAGHVRMASFSGDGTYIYAVRLDRRLSQNVIEDIARGMPAPTDETLLAYNVKSGATRDIYRLKPGEGTIASIVPFGGGSNALVEVLPSGAGLSTSPTRPTLILLANPGRTTSLESGNFQASFSVSSSKTRPLTAVVQVVPPSVTMSANVPPPDAPNLSVFMVHFYDVTGKVVWSGNLPQNVARSLDWGNDGLPYFSTHQKGPRDQLAPRQWFRFNFTTGNMDPIQVAPALPDLTKGPLDIHFAGMSGQAKTVNAIWLTTEKDKRELLVGSDTGEDAEIAPTGDAILYTSQGLGLVRPIVSISREAYLQALKAAARNKIIHNAKQVALALIIYSADYDDTYPAGSDFPGQVQPYVKDVSVLSQFVYTFGGGKMTDIKDPATTELGYIAGDGGRAVAYADGHVVWKPG